MDLGFGKKLEPKLFGKPNDEGRYSFGSYRDGIIFPRELFQ